MELFYFTPFGTKRLLKPLEKPCQTGPKLTSRSYFLCPFLIVAVVVRVTSLTRFVENTCNICIFK